MQISWLHLFPALVLLWFPIIRALESGTRLRTYESLRKMEVNTKRKPWWWLPLLWLDPFRAGGGAILLTLSFLPPEKAKGLARLLPIIAPVVILAIGVIIQTRPRRSDDEITIAPILFLLGIVFGLLPLKVALPAMILATTSMVSFRTWASFFYVGAAAVMGLGYFFMGKNLWMLGTVALLGLPIMVNLTRGSFLAHPSRR